MPKARVIGHKFRLIDKPDKRKQHDKGVVRIGGLAIAIGFFISLIVAILLTGQDSSNNILFTVVFGALGLFLVGFADDILNLSSSIRLLFQILISIFTWSRGIRIETFSIPFLLPNTIELPLFISFFITVFLLVAIINSINWMDGLDGLCAGLACISALGFSAIHFSIGAGNPVLIMAALSGSCFGFLLFNFHPAKIFMGDGGSYLLGYILASFTIYSFSKNTEIIPNINLILHALILFLPLLDMLFVILSRIIENKSPFLPDRKHLHHRLLRAGFTHKSSVIFCYLISQWFVSLALLLILPQYNILIFIISTSLLLYFSIYKNKYISSKNFRINK